ncbi:hypothetical protein HAINFHK1212_1430 [Haemophilus influenzae HK1212]|uniref:Uncharacterized protein n=1 Tax=Haemophilus influenzae HK1212 TaxID=456482 RepID=A0A7G2K0B3_HAEIF|nr:hypothetical protein HAINFHK1212_1430 [Haemophilus influenzae HK1212]
MRPNLSYQAKTDLANGALMEDFANIKRKVRLKMLMILHENRACLSAFFQYNSQPIWCQLWRIIHSRGVGRKFL